MKFSGSLRTTRPPRFDTVVCPGPGGDGGGDGDGEDVPLPLEVVLGTSARLVNVVVRFMLIVTIFHCDSGLPEWR